MFFWSRICVALGVLRTRWKHPGEVVPADDVERRAQWDSFELLKRDVRFLRLRQQLRDNGYRTAFEQIADPAVYRIVYIDLWDTWWQQRLAQNGAAAHRIVAYLERDAAPRRIRACLNLQTGECVASEAAWMVWECVPSTPLHT